MKRRPVPVIVLGVLQILTPFLNLVLNSFAYEVSPITLVRDLVTRQTTHDIFVFFLLGPIAGIAVLAFRRWSYVVFLSCIAWGTLVSLANWYRFPQSVSLGLVLAVAGANAFVATYFLLPAVRLAYWEGALRWWEAHPRYRINQEASFATPDGHETLCRVSNVSEGGIFIEGQCDFRRGTSIRMRFRIGSRDFILPGRIAFLSSKPLGFGVQFQSSPRNKIELKEAIEELDAAGVESLREKSTIWGDVRAWWQELRATKHLWIPDVTPEMKERAVSSQSEIREKKNEPKKENPRRAA